MRRTSLTAGGMQVSAIGWALLAALAAGCGRPAGAIFPPVPDGPSWPPPPEAARIRYVGQLSTNEDLKPAKTFAQRLGEAVFGKKPFHAMLTPFALCTDQQDRLFVADSNGQLVHVFNLNTRQYDQWRPSGRAAFSQPVGMAYDPAGRLIVADSVAAVLWVFDAEGRFLGPIGEEPKLFQRPCGLAVDPTTRRIFVADAAAHQIVVLSADGQLVRRLGGRGRELGQFNYPTNVAFDSQGWLYVSDSLNFRVQQFDADLRPVRQIGKHGDMPGYFSQPRGLAVDSHDHLYVIDAHFEAVQIFSADGSLLLTFGDEGSRPGQFWMPTGLFIDRNNRIWIADSYNRRVQVFDYCPEESP